MNSGDPGRKIICQKCHRTYSYDVKSQNICPNDLCLNNPTYYEDSDLGPYKQFSFPLKKPNTVYVREQEPSGLNPNGKTNLRKLHSELKNEHWEGFPIFPFVGDGLPGISYERMKSEYVHCAEHNADIPLMDPDLLAEHCCETCTLQWPLSDLYVICGESHEKLLMNGTSLIHATNFGVLDLLAEMGRYTKPAQLQALKTKNLHTLYEMNYIFLKGSITAIIVPFLNYCAELNMKPTVNGLNKFVSSSKNLKYKARFKYLFDVSLICFLKIIGVRLNNKKIARGASALFFPVVFAFPHSFYRDFYHLLYLNGPFVPLQETISPLEPDISRFLRPLISVKPNLEKYPTRNPTENIKFGEYRDKYAHVTESDRADGHQGAHFVQEDCLGRVMTHLKKGEIFDREQFAQAVRSCQISRDSEQQKDNVVVSKSRRPKYENEVMSLAAIILDKDEDPNEEDDLEDLNVDVLNISQIGHTNYKVFFEKKIDATPTGSIKLKPALFTKCELEEYNKIENQTKSIITKEILNMMDKIDFEDENEKKYFEGRIKKTVIKKDELIEMFNELKTKLILYKDS